LAKAAEYRSKVWSRRSSQQRCWRFLCYRSYQGERRNESTSCVSEAGSGVHRQWGQRLRTGPWNSL